MTKTEKVNFVRDISNRVRDDIIQKIKDGKVLNEWDGHELRTLLRDRHEESASMSKQAMKGKRGKVYRNHVLVANL